MKDKKKEEVLKKSFLLSKQISETLDSKKEHISSVRYYEDFFFAGVNLEENDVYIVEIKSQNPEIGENNIEKNANKDASEEKI